jgi:hypothetical protein
MPNYLQILLSAAVLFSCSSNEPNHSQKEIEIETATTITAQTEKGTELITPNLGMTMDELREKYNDCEFIEQPVFKYGIDGESLGLLIRKDNEDLFFAWPIPGENTVNGITLLSPSFVIDGNVHVGMSVKSFFEKYQEATIHIDMIDENYEYINVSSISYRPEFLTTDTNRIANYDYDQPEPEYKSLARENARIERISF